MSNRDVREAFPRMGYYVLGRRRSGGGAWLVRSIDDGSEWEGRVLQASGAGAADACTSPDPAAEAFLQRRHRHVERVVARRSDPPAPTDSPAGARESPRRAYTVSEVLSPLCADARFSRPVSDDAFWAAASELLEGLCSFHSNGLRHGDVCLANVRVAASGGGGGGGGATSAAAVKLANACVDGCSRDGGCAEDVRGLALALWELCTGESLAEILHADGDEVRRRADERVTACLGDLSRYCPQLGAEACALPGRLYGCGHGAEECLLWPPVASRVLCAWYAPFVCRTLQALGGRGAGADDAGCGCGLPSPLCVCAAAAAAEEGSDSSLLFSLSGHKVLAAGGPAEGHASAVAAALRWKADVAAWRSEVVGWRRRQQHRQRRRRRRRRLQGGGDADNGGGSSSSSDSAPPIPELPFVIRGLGHSSGSSDGGCDASGDSETECGGSGEGFAVSAVVAGAREKGHALQASAGTTQTAFTIPHAGSIAGISFAGAATGKTVGTFGTMTQAPGGGGGEEDSTISCSSLFSLMYGSDESSAAVCVETLLSRWSDNSASSALSTHTHSTY